MFLLVNPPGLRQGPCFDVPTNILYLVSALRDADVPHDWVDGNMVGMTGVKAKIDELHPDIVGISCLTPVRFNVWEVAKYAKKRGSKTVVGNYHANWMWKQILDNYDYVDAIAFGEGEGIVVDLATMPWEDIPGIAYRCAPGEYVRNHVRPFVKNLDDISFPAWDKVDWPWYKNAGAIGPRLYYSRGCMGRCKFCNATAFWRGYRYRSPSNFCDELEWVYGMGQHGFVFGDDNATGDGAIDLFTEMHSRMHRIPHASSSVTTRVDAITSELCHLMKACGVHEVCVGVESGSQYIIDHLRKDITVQQAKDAVKWIKGAGMQATVLLINNSIGERPEDKTATRRFLEETQPDAIGGINALWLHPHTRYYNEVRAGKYDHLISQGKEWVNDDFFLDPRYAQHVIAWRDGRIFPMSVTDYNDGVNS